MCGIAGAVFWDGPPEGVDPTAVVRSMTSALAHRGPDGDGILAVGGGHAHVGALGHRRLAIIDLSERAAQPMTSRRLPISITYNGEIYNFKDLRRELEAHGREFRSDSDSEVILQGYEQWGRGVVDRLSGMFAFAIWDGRAGELLLARDRFGIKPLYIHRTRNRVLFASEMRALLASGLVPKQLDLIAVDRYLSYQTVPAPQTLVADVRLMPPASISVHRSGSADETVYWNALDDSGATARSASLPEVREHVGTLLTESAAGHLISDVPVGLFLSGGVDSTAVAALVRRSGTTPRTFCVSFPDMPHDEGPPARAAAAALGAEHTEIPLTESDCRRQLPDAVAAIDHPSADGINTYIVSRAVRGAGIKVALSGLGGDELFGGYPSFRRLRRLASYARAWRLSPGPMRRAVAAAVRSMAGSSIAAAKTAALLETDGALPSTYPLMRQLFSRERRTDLIGPAIVDASARESDPYATLLERAMADHPDAGLMSLVSYAEARTYMHDVLLRDTDQMSMRHGLEVRVPLLDHRLAEYVMGLSDAEKGLNGAPKQLLIDAVGDLPPAVRRPKQGFTLPFDAWMRGDLRSFCEHHLGDDGLASRPLFQRQGVTSVWQAFLRGDASTTWSRAWALVALNAWLEQTGVAP